MRLGVRGTWGAIFRATREAHAPSLPGAASEEDSWNVFSHSHTLVDIPESRSLEGLTVQQVERLCPRAAGAMGLQKLDTETFLCTYKELHFSGRDSRGSFCF